MITKIKNLFNTIFKKKYKYIPKNKDYSDFGEDSIYIPKHRDYSDFGENPIGKVDNIKDYSLKKEKAKEPTFEECLEKVDNIFLDNFPYRIDSQLYSSKATFKFTKESIKAIKKPAKMTNQDALEHYNKAIKSDLFAEFCNKERLQNINFMSRKFDRLIKLDLKNVDCVVNCIAVLRAMANYLKKRSSQIYTEYKKINAGLSGENDVYYDLKQFKQFRILRNLTLRYNNEDFENDMIILSTHGIYILEIKNYGINSNYELIIEADGQWLKRSLKTRAIEPMNNVTSQNNRHISLLNNLINSHFENDIDKFIETKGITVIANNKVHIKNNSIQPIFRSSEIYEYITNQPNIFTSTELDEIEDLLIHSRIPDKKYEVINFFDEAENINEIDRLLTEINSIIANCSKILQPVTNGKKII